MEKREKLAIPLSEFLENYPVGEPLATDSDPFQDTITAQLIQHQMRVQFSSLVKQGRVSYFNRYNLTQIGFKGQSWFCLLTHTRFS